MKLTDPHLIRRDRAAEWRRLSAHLRQHPEDFQIALDNLDRWDAWGRTHPGPIQEWRGLIQQARSNPQAMERLLEWLASDNHDAEPLKGCSPFVGPPFTTLPPSP